MVKLRQADTLKVSSNLAAMAAWVDRFKPKLDLVDRTVGLWEVGPSRIVARAAECADGMCDAVTSRR